MGISSANQARRTGSDAIYCDLHAGILAGRSGPGARLHTCRELAAQYAVSPMTAQRVLDRLVAQGFAVARGTHGTFVADHPPHLYRYGIVFPSDPTGGDSGWWPPGWDAMDQEAARVHEVDPRREVVRYYNITGHSDVEDYQRLLTDLKNGRLAGLMFAAPANEALRETPLFEDPQLPRVVMQDAGVAGLSIGFSFDSWKFLHSALDWFASRRRRRVAVVHLPNSAILDERRATEAIERHGMRTKPYWLLPINHHTPFTAAPIIRLLMSSSRRQRPDALYLANPFLVESATEGLAQSGVQIPDELDVVAAANFPYVSQVHVPVRWLGSDIRDLICQGVEVIDRCRRGEKLPRSLPYQKIFGEELPEQDPLCRLLPR